MSNQLYNAINNLNSLHTATMTQLYDHVSKLESRLEDMESKITVQEEPEEDSAQAMVVKLYGIERSDTKELIPYKGRTLRITRDDNVKLRNDPGFQNKLRSLGLKNSDVKFVVATFKMEGTWKTQK